MREIFLVAELTYVMQNLRTELNILGGKQPNSQIELLERKFILARVVVAMAGALPTTYTNEITYRKR